MLVRCLYASHATVPTTSAIVSAILAESRRNNPRNGITGMLCFTSSTFIQVLEGGRDRVGELLVNLMRDDRHRDVRILTYDEISERRFGNWTMGQVRIDSVNPALLLKYFELPELNPFEGSGHATLSLLEELAATGSIPSSLG